MKAFIKLIRWQNLVIVILTQVLVRYAIVAPLISKIPLYEPAAGLQVFIGLQLTVFEFIALVFATVCITAGGYVINDYFDVRTDLLNKGEVVIGTKIPRRRAMMWHNVLNALGVIAGFWVSYQTGYFWAGLIFLLVSGLLYFYSATYKKQFLLGNLIVAILTSLVPLMIVIFDVLAVYNYYGSDYLNMSLLRIPVYWVTGLAAFAFLTTLVRELIKDIEDYKGDKATGSQSLPVLAGINIAKSIVSFLIIITILLLVFVWTKYLMDSLSLIYILILIIVPLLLVIFIIIRGRSSKQYNRASVLMKVIMLAGICYILMMWLVLEKGIAI